MVDNGEYVERIREEIRRSGKTMTKLAVEAGMTPEQMSDILNNRRWLRAVEMDRITAAAG